MTPTLVNYVQVIIDNFGCQIYLFPLSMISIDQMTYLEGFVAGDGIWPITSEIKAATASNLSDRDKARIKLNLFLDASDERCIPPTVYGSGGVTYPSHVRIVKTFVW